MSDFIFASPLSTHHLKTYKAERLCKSIPPGISTASFSKPARRFSGNTFSNCCSGGKQKQDTEDFTIIRTRKPRHLSPLHVSSLPVTHLRHVYLQIVVCNGSQPVLCRKMTIPRLNRLRQKKIMAEQFVEMTATYLVLESRLLVAFYEITSTPHRS